MNNDANTKKPYAALSPGNREVLTDLFASGSLMNEPQLYAFKVYVRLNAMKQTRFQNVSFRHSIFESAYFNRCFFNSCDFTGCRFVSCNFHQSAFSGCVFDYATFERCQIDDDILDNEAPSQDNLKLRFARTLRMNFQQIGDAKAVNKAILLELDATANYLRKSWLSSESYYREKYAGWKKLRQFIRWAEFRMLDAIWGNGESTLKLLRTLMVVHVLIAIYDTAQFRDPWSLRAYLDSLVSSPGIFFGITTPGYFPVWVCSAIAALRLIGFAFLTAILVKRFGRR
ncbi:hypothetical protein GTP55_07680 [Duganella sp. FT109W]|uniref:Pentapeptide repeat-containing protein n=1 Tax=Duganella margarita TaxID=2692170 RepID=A0ABW9WDS1_9BURK|nr:pentapeptide repeat-containing protein [Duganella margarita]MYN39247.1 hypothetical protein [Duganella margarita]